MKKVLSIVLSVAMVICLMPAMAFAADSNSTAATGLSKFSDASSITNKEAVSVLAGLGVINGKGDGTFDPKGDVTRAETSTLVSILVRSGDSSSLSAPSKDPFTDVAKDNWAAPYVAYGVSQGYLNGRGDGTFDPTGNVTTAQLATILEQILGYSKTDVAYQWPENAMAYANEANLLTGISKGANDNLDREEAAQMIFNALKADDVVKLTTTGSDIQTGYNSVKNSSDLSYKNDAQDKTEQLVEKLFPKVALASKKADDFGRIASAWMNGRTQISDEVTETPAYKYTSAQKDLVKGDLKGYGLKSVVVYENGAKTENVDLTTTDNAIKADIDNLTGNGVLVELYTNPKDTAITKAVVVSYTAEKVADVATNEIKLGENGADTISSTDSFYDAVKTAAKGDYVLVAKNAETNKILDAYLPTTVNGAVTQTTSSTATVGGTSYAYAKDAKALPLSNTAYNVYLDKYGYIKTGEAVTASKVAANYIYVTGTASTQNTADKYSTDKATYSHQIIGVDENGNIVKDQAVSTADTVVDNSSESQKPVDLTKADEKYTIPTGVYAYKETASGYVLTKTDESTLSHIGTYTNAVNSGASKIDKDYVASDVSVVTITGTGSNISAAKSTSVPNLSENGYSYVVKNDGTQDVVKTIFVWNKTAVSPSSSTYYVVGATADQATKYANNAAGTPVQTYSVTYYELGSTEAKTMYVSNTDVKPGFYTATVDGDVTTLDTAKSVAHAVTTPTAIGDIYVAGNKITFGDTTYKIADSAIIDARNVKNSADKITTLAGLDKNKSSVKVTYVTDAAGATITQLFVTAAE
ncbi:MAG: S-layer homology domain-containing protein [Eubacteriales bacterium]|nr:S-layer homology domain-containing protein [Eubacteriales bacterium]